RGWAANDALALSPFAFPQPPGSVVFPFPIRLPGVIVKNMLQFLRTPAQAASLLLVVALLASGCESESPDRPAGAASSARADGSRKASERAGSSGAKAVAAKKTEFGKNVWLETAGEKRRVIVGATVVLREGSFGLECLMCRKQTKEHESILAADADAMTIHGTLLAAGA